MLTLIWNARKLLSQPVELFMQYIWLSISVNSVADVLIMERQQQVNCMKVNTLEFLTYNPLIVQDILDLNSLFA